MFMKSPPLFFHSGGFGRAAIIQFRQACVPIRRCLHASIDAAPAAVAQVRNRMM
jgi:hypothetical protein